jgi:hypothetical protein
MDYIIHECFFSMKKIKEWRIFSFPTKVISIKISADYDSTSTWARTAELPWRVDFM